MRKVCCLLFVVQCFNPLFCQDWIRYYGTGQQAVAWHCIEQYDKGYILLGNINNYKYGWIVKTDINGNELWNIKIGDGVHMTTPVVVEETFDHGLILGGSTKIFNPSANDPFIMKLNVCGELEWCRVLIYDQTSDVGIDVKQTTDGGFVLLAELYGNDPNDRIHLFKFDDIGELFWHKIYSRDSIIYGEILRSLYVDSTNFLITAFCYYPNWIKPYYIQTDTSGNENWRLIYSQHTGLGYVGDAWATVRDKFGNYYSAGRREGSPELLKFSGNGYEMMNVDLFPNAQGGNAMTILFLNDTTPIIGAGWTMNGTTGYLGMLKTDTLGAIQTIKYLPDPDHSGIVWTTKTFDNKIIAIGTNFIGSQSRMILFKFNSNLEYDSIYTQSFTYDSLCPDTIVSHTIMPDCDVITGLNEPFTNPEDFLLKVYPNPATNTITVEIPQLLQKRSGPGGFQATTVYHKWGSAILEVYDLFGKKQLERVVHQGQLPVTMDVSRWPRGMYVFRLSFRGEMVAMEKVVVE